MDELRTYAVAVFSNWLEGYWVVTAIPAIASRAARFLPWVENVTAWLDRQVPRDTRQRLFDFLFLFGIFVAGFLAWQDQHQLVVELSKPKPTTTQQQVGATAFSSMSNSSLKSYTLDQVGQIRALIQRTQNFVSNPERQQAVRDKSIEEDTWQQSNVTAYNTEMWQYKLHFAAKAVVLCGELRRRLPDYVAQMDPTDLESADRSYNEPFNIFDIDTVVSDLDKMANELPND